MIFLIITIPSNSLNILIAIVFSNNFKIPTIFSSDLSLLHLKNYIKFMIFVSTIFAG